MENNVETENIDISDTVAEITSVISKHITRVIEQVSNKNNDASQNMEILNQLPIVKNLRSENELLRKQLQELQEKYKNTLEDLIQLRSKEKITMEITELDKPTNQESISMEEIVNSLKEDDKPISLWGLSNASDDDEDDDAQPILSLDLGTNDDLRQKDKNCDISAEEERLAIDNWVSFHKDSKNSSVDVSKADDEILIDIMKS